LPTAWDNYSDYSDYSDQIPKIAICIPYNGKFEPEWVDKTYVPLRYVPTNWCTKITFLSKVQSLPVARDMLVNTAIQAGCDYIFFMDTDHVFESPNDPNIALHQLYQTINKSKNMNIDKKVIDKNGKIVSAIYRTKQKHGFGYAAWMKYGDKGFIPITQWTGNWLEIDVAGLGCCLISSEVFKDIPRPWFKWEMKDEMSEDFYFYQHAKKYGYNAHLFTDVKLSHLGNLKVMLDGSITTPDM
jgi:hypothetical protein